MRRGKAFRWMGKAIRACGFLTFTAIILMGMLYPAISVSEEVRPSSSQATPKDAADHPAPSRTDRTSAGDSHAADSRTDKGKTQQGIDEVVRLTPEMIKMSDIRTQPVEYRTLVKEIQTVGEITYDERRIKEVAAWIGGRIDHLYVDFTGIQVKKGDPLADLYSPELVSTQLEFILALETRARIWSLGNEEALRSATALVEATKQRLLLWGITRNQIDEIERTRKVSNHMTIYAPIGGTVVHKQAYEGQYVKTGEKLYTIVDLSLVWAQADVYEYEMAWVKVGQKVSLSTPAYAGVDFTGTVSFIDPFLSTKTRSVKVRMDVPNAHLNLRPGMFVEARLKIPIGDKKPVLAVPYTAILETGIRKLAYVDLGQGMFRPVEVKVGPRAGDWVQVVSGLSEGQNVAVSANYLIDSQRTLGAGAAGGFGGAVGTGHGGH